MNPTSSRATAVVTWHFADVHPGPSAVRRTTAHTGRRRAGFDSGRLAMPAGTAAGKVGRHRSARYRADTSPAMPPAPKGIRGRLAPDSASPPVRLPTGHSLATPGIRHCAIRLHSAPRPATCRRLDRAASRRGIHPRSDPRSATWRRLDRAAPHRAIRLRSEPRPSVFQRRARAASSRGIHPRSGSRPATCGRLDRSASRRGLHPRSAARPAT